MEFVMTKAQKYRYANLPGLDRNKFVYDFDTKAEFTGFADKTIRFIEDFGLKNEEQWDRFVNQFIKQDDSNDNGWRGEYWGKMMRGASFVYSYTGKEELYVSLTDSVNKMLEIGKKYGRVSSYKKEKEMCGWDMWCRKYVLLGMQYYLEICRDDEMCDNIVEFMCNQLDGIMELVGDEQDGKMPITHTSNYWFGVNSASLLEPVVRLYKITGEKKYLKFAEHIAGTGASTIRNLFDLAYEDEFLPYQYPVTKAYEITSCFDGLLELYFVTGNERYRKSVVNYAKRVLESEFTVIGGSGCSHELFDHSTVRQANTTNGATMQETCVTVTVMKFFLRVLMLTGDFSFADAFECSLYNAYFGAVNTEKAIEPLINEKYPYAKAEPLPFDSYSPLTAGTRGNGIGGFKLFDDNHYFGCCASIGAMGAGLIPKAAVMKSSEGIVINLYIPGKVSFLTPEGQKAVLDIRTQYPKNGEISVIVEIPKDEQFSIMIRNPKWSRDTKIDGEFVKSQNGYIEINKIWKNSDVIKAEFDMGVQAISPISYGTQIIMDKTTWGRDYMLMLASFDREDVQAKNHRAFRRGPVVMAMDSRLGYDLKEASDIKIGADGYVEAIEAEGSEIPYKHIIALKLPLRNGGFVKLTDYASAGKLLNKDSEMAAWIKVR